MAEIGRIERFMRLFQANTRSYGVFDPKNKGDKKMFSVKKLVTKDLFEQHIKGTKGLGLVPILDDNTCLWAAIDIDIHGEDDNIDLYELEREITEADLPLTLCRSKSGGAHLYLFCTEPVSCSLVRSVMNKWAVQLGYSGAEVFPKQDKLIKEKEGRQYGNWINLCYFGGDKSERYAVEGGKKITFDYFLEVAESRRITAPLLVEKSEGDHEGAPPCIHRMISSGVPIGMRNNALYNLSIYLKQAYPETWRDKAFDMNARVLSPPLAHSEAKKTIASVARREYRYKCKEEPCRSRCNSYVCVERKFGITPDEKSELNMGKHPNFNQLRKYMTEPVKWGLDIDGVEVNVTTPELMDHRKVREAVADKLTQIIPTMKNERWVVVLQKLMESALVIDAPDEASTHGLVWQQLMLFLQRADLDADGKDTSARELLLRGVPVLQEKNGDKIVYFRGSDFVSFLKKNRAEDLKGPNLWFALKKHGVTHGSLRIGNTTRQVWNVPLDLTGVHDPSDIEIKPEY